MGTQEGELSGLAQRSDAAPTNGGGLTEQQLANLARIDARLGVDHYVNPNTVDTAVHLVEHGFAPDSRPPA